jgi:hypothetical protein
MLEALKDPDKPLDTEIERARAMSGIAAKIIESAKVEVKFAEVTGLKVKEGFFDEPPRSLPQAVNGRKAS